MTPAQVEEWLRIAMVGALVAGTWLMLAGAAWLAWDVLRRLTKADE